MNLLRFYRRPAISGFKKDVILKTLPQSVSMVIKDIETEFCYYIETINPLSPKQEEIILWLLKETFDEEGFSSQSFLGAGIILEVGPRLNFATSWCSNAISVFRACGIDEIKRIERSRRFKIISDTKISDKDISLFLNLIYDAMTECPYQKPLETFKTDIFPKPVITLPLIENGKSVLEDINKEMGLGFDSWDIDFYYDLFANDLKRNPTDVELFDLSQSNSEHSRHWFFKGRLIIDGKEIPHTLMQIVKQPYLANPNNSIIAFKDNSSAIRGFDVVTIEPTHPFHPSSFIQKNKTFHIIFTAETHNFPTGVAPFPGAETGTGGRIRDVHATGRGSLVCAGTAGYSVGNLFIPDYPLPWEHGSLIYPSNLASPLRILIEASNGASDYGNKFGEPVIQGFCRSFGLRLHNGERWEWIKPIMFTGGVGFIDDIHVEKGNPSKGMLVVKIGGPAYRIGIGGGSASSMISGDNIEALDFNAVQRGDAEMEQRLNRVVRACVEMADKNPIISIHDQGAGGNCNVVKEIIHPEGARIDINKIILGDETLSYLEIWGAEYQEQDAVLINPDRIDEFKEICSRERLPVAVIGEITGDGRLFLYSSKDNIVIEDLPLQKVLGDMPPKTYHLKDLVIQTDSLKIPPEITFIKALEMVLRHPSVCSKLFLTKKVDRSVTGLIAQQQCVGPLQLPISDFAMVSQSHFTHEGRFSGSAISIGEQPIKSLINPSSMARLAVTEAITNIVWAGITRLEDIKCSANWMWAPKIDSEGARLYESAVAMGEFMITLGIAVDGGKDSLSMAAKVRNPDGSIETVKSPPTLVISAYAPVPDITKKVTPDIKKPGISKLIFVDLSNGQNRLGGSILAHCLKQVGDISPDMDNPQALKNTFHAIQLLIKEGLILAGHDRSDGGLIVTLLEMAFGGNCGFDVDIKTLETVSPFEFFFSEEPGLIFEYLKDDEAEIVSILERFDVSFKMIGNTLSEKNITIRLNDETIISEDMLLFKSWWQETSYRLDMLQANPQCVNEEMNSTYDCKGLQWDVRFEYDAVNINIKAKPPVAIIREEGSNGDREMASAFYYAGFEPWDVTMSDLLNGKITLDRFKGIAFVGGFSYADVLDSAKGWAGTIRFNEKVREQFDRFYNKTDTFSLGVCNGCQLMALLGWVPYRGIADTRQPRFIHNVSGRFESRFLNVMILKSNAIMLSGMEESILGVWIAHGEGRAYFPDEDILQVVLRDGLAPIRYVDTEGNITQTYPFNPNGSTEGIAGLCSKDGRHLALMPHPERSFLSWQLPFSNEIINSKIVSPWIKLFTNAKNWVDSV
ncbi:MAG: phosphoribosylformylglycinamidine synthase [Thermodesulfovibrionales bacterium]|nr:phosphoribosylformylglycinamidine synthase [Thermodesulfovibrionales bacterium]